MEHPYFLRGGAFLEINALIAHGCIGHRYPYRRIQPSEQRQLRVGEAECLAMKGCRAKLGDGVAVGSRGVSFIYGPAIARVAAVECFHKLVAVCLGKD